jgi:hypothetical protein
MCLGLPRRDAVVLGLDFADAIGDPAFDRFHNPLVMTDHRTPPSLSESAKQPLAGTAARNQTQPAAVATFAQFAELFSARTPAELTGEIKGTGVPIRQPVCRLTPTSERGPIGRAPHFQSWDKALEAAGLRE